MLMSSATSSAVSATGIMWRMSLIPLLDSYAVEAHVWQLSTTVKTVHLISIHELTHQPLHVVNQSQHVDATLSIGDRQN